MIEAMSADVVDEPMTWTSVSSLAPRWLERFTSVRRQTFVTLDIAEVSRGLEAFARIFDYNRSHYLALVLERGLNSQLEGSWQVGWASAFDLFSTPSPLQGAAATVANPRATQAYVEELLKWLQCTYDDLASMTDISRRAFFYWRQTGAIPRPTNLRSLLRLHSLVGALVRRFGPAGARAWLDAGDPAPRDVLLQGDIIRVESLFRESLMRQPEDHDRYARRLDESTAVLELEQPEPQQLRRAGRRPRRGPLPGP